jgi:lipopolysaccharide export system protein LptC
MMVIATLAAGVWAGSAQNTDQQVITGFRVPEYDDQGRMKSQLFGDYARIPMTGPIEVHQLKYEFYTANSTQAEMRITAPLCFYDREHGEAHSDGAVRIARDDMVVTGVGFNFSRATERMVIHHQVKVVLKGMRRQEGFIP